jgi:hypothetical protein
MTKEYSLGDAILRRWLSEWPLRCPSLPVYLRPKGTAWGGISVGLLRTVTHAGPGSAIDCGTQRQPYFLKVRWTSYPVNSARVSIPLALQK